MKECTKCKESKTEDQFRFRSDRRTGRVTVCKACTQKQNTENMRRWREANPEEYKQRRFASDLKRNYGITVDEFELLLEDQGERCPICSRLLTQETRNGRHVDHCHSCREVRGITCGKCNTAMGLVGDSLHTLRRMIDYIDSHEKGCTDAAAN